MTYGLSDDKITEKMEEELKEKALRTIKSTIMRKAQGKIIEDLEKTFNRILNLKERKKKENKLKRKRLSYMLKNGMIDNEELESIKRTICYLLYYVFLPLQKFHIIHTNLVDILNHDKINWLGLRRTHAYITFDKFKPIKYIDILRTQNGFDLYFGIKQDLELQLISQGYKVILEQTTTSRPLRIPEKTHTDSGDRRNRKHFKLTSINNNEVKNKDELKNKVDRAILKVKNVL